MPRLPQPGGDVGDWGVILNEFLAQSHKPDGTLQDNSIPDTALADGLVSESKLAPDVQAKLNAVASGGVVSVNGHTGVVSLVKADLSLGNVDNTSDVNKPISTATQTALNTKESTITAGTTGQYYRGDKTWQTLPSAPVTSVNTLTGAVVLAKADVGLSNADNTSDANKPVSSAAQTALNLKAPLASPTFTGTVTVPTPTSGTDATTKTYVDNAVTGVATPDATTLVKGKVQLAGDLAGTAASPTVPGLAAKEPTITAGTTSQYWRGDKTFQTLDKAAVGIGNVDNTSDTNKPVSTAQQTALNLKANLASPTFTGTVTVPTPTNTTDAVTKAYVDGVVGSGVADATTLVKGKIQLAGDLSGTAALPTVPGLAGKESTITATTSADYYRGDKTFQTLNKAAVGLGNVDNTSDTNKPVSTAQQTALNLKANLASPTFTGTVSGVTASMVGLSNVDNTSDANKPVSTATQTALNLKADATSVGVKTLLINTAGDLPAGTPAGVVVVVKS